MEPMTLGSPSGSPATNTSQYLPSFLMGDPVATTPRNTLSPTKAGRNVSFATSPTVANSPQDFNRSSFGQKTLFSHQQTTAAGANYPGTPLQNQNISVSGPPTQGLFDVLHSERNQIQTPQHSNISQFCELTNQQIDQFPNNHSFGQQQFNDSYLSTNSFNASRLASPLANNGPSPLIDFRGVTPGNNSHLLQGTPIPRYKEFWVTVFGFPSSATNMIVQHFAQCGTIVDKIYATQNGNWVHLKFSSRLECDKALTYNEKILGNNIMIGVTQCKDSSIMDKENISETNFQTPKVRPLAQTAYRSVQSESSVVQSPSAPAKSTGIVNRAMDLFFGW